MAYGHLGQQRSGTPVTRSSGTRAAKGGAAPKQQMRGYGPTSSTNKTSRGRDVAPQQKIRGFKKVMGRQNLPTRNVSAGRIKKGRA